LADFLRTIGKNGKPTATNPDKNGKIQHAFRMPTTRC
jgi:hypothetical protein